MKFKKAFCKNCGEERLADLMEKGVCILCRNADRNQGVEVKTSRYASKRGVTVKSRTGRIDENRHLGKWPRK